MKYPDTIIHNGYVFTKQKIPLKISGLNPKVVYKNPKNELFLAKTEKERSYKSIFQDSIANLNVASRPYQTHLDDLRDSSVATQYIASYIAKTILPSLHVPHNFLLKLNDGTPIILSKLIPEQFSFNELLTNSNFIKSKKPELNSPLFWKKCQLPHRTAFDISASEATALGKIYYIGLLLSHWDIVNNIDLSNSGTVKINGALHPCIVDWGNCLGIGFGGLSQDATSFNNPEFKSTYSDSNSVTGFIGCTPFDDIVYPKLPRQVVNNLFDISSKNTLSCAMFKGFKEAHKEAEKNLKYVKPLPLDFNSSFLKSINKSLFLGTKKSSPEILPILRGRHNSLTNIIYLIESGLSIDKISKIQFDKILTRQDPTRRVSLL